MFSALTDDELYVFERKLTSAYVKVRETYGPWGKTSLMLFDLMMEAYYSAMSRRYYLNV